MPRQDFSEIIKQLQKNRENLQRAIQPITDYYRDFQKQIADATKPLIDQVKEFQDGIKRQGIDIASRIKMVSDEIEQCKLILLEYGFPPHYDMDIRQMRRISQFYKDNGVEETHRLLNRFLVMFFTDDRIKGYCNKWTNLKWLEDRHNILKEAVEAHTQEMYFASISTLIPQIEGVIFSHNEFVGKTSTNKLKEFVDQILNESGSFSFDQTVRLFYIDFVLDNFIFGTEIKSPLSRHAIAHGGDTKFGYKLNSIRSIVLFDYLIESICESKDIK